MLWCIAILGSLLFYLFCVVQLGWGLQRLRSCQAQRLPFVSIIIAMKNEQNQARACLDAVTRQQYPHDALEIIVVDDGSVDNTPTILAEYQRQYSWLRVLRLENRPADWGGKKYALQQAIAHSEGEIMLFTDADCLPPPNWVRSMMACFEDDVGVVAGFSPLVDPSNSLLGKMLACDSLAAGVVAAGGIGWGRPITAVGRNLAYRRVVFEEVGGFDQLKHHVSGDDDLLLQLVHRSTRWRCCFAVALDSIVPSYQTISWRHFFVQKIRHLSAGKGYDLELQVGYFLFHLSNLVLMSSFWIAWLMGANIGLAAAALVAKGAADYWLLARGANIFQMNRVIKYFPLWEIFFWLSHVIIGPISWIAQVKWKPGDRTSST
ncbi:MAG: glycosyltransferase [candidate division KSB1 bacterium]|nr:glycosyltransferase [candidate division KSB1 bacterium]